ncbi:lasso peptide biosynthesis protein [Nocardia sp. CDC159]|uniref:Lasso peptide biosynthesis protein n=1 Tax=Nocardia pulmonis TaxID=2951408 RepID=A0A9X2J1W3_9NOCA|nr:MULTISPECIES: lasso peptide biosynthesis protein [Nocardia]MCM6778510.1 lasso peptide biosynthesis protein [Nocardia pulmonis]MCM6791399.1 lasso peptide biosynthesis protein [Nocardia sp. CDC159]
MTDLAYQLESMLCDIDGVPAPPRIPLRLRSYAMRRTWRALRLLGAQGWGPSHTYLRDLHPGPGWRTPANLPPAVAIRLASREILFSQLTLRATHPNGLCLPRSLSLATYLCSLGLPAEVIIARSRTCTSPTYSFHSWTELYGEVLNDNQDVTIGFSVMQRVTARAVGVGFEPTVA